MVKIIYWSLLPIGSFVAKRTNQCINFGVGFVCGAAQTVGIEISNKTKNLCRPYWMNWLKQKEKDSPNLDLPENNNVPNKNNEF